MCNFWALDLTPQTPKTQSILERVLPATTGRKAYRVLTAFYVLLCFTLSLPVWSHARGLSPNHRELGEYLYPDGLFSCEGPSGWIISEHGPAKDGLGPGVTFLQPLGESLVSLRYFPRSGAYRGRRLIPPAYRSTEGYYRQRVREAVYLSSSIKDALPVHESQLLSGSWKGRQAFEFSLSYTEEFNDPEARAGRQRMRDDVVLLPTAAGFFAIDYSAETKHFERDRSALQAILKTLRLKPAGEPAVAGAEPVPQFPNLKSAGLSTSDSGNVGEMKQGLGSITGRVTDQENTSVPHVRVTAEGGPHGGKFSTETGQNGDYRLSGLNPGLYQVTFINVGFQVVVFRKVKVVPGKTVTLNVRLRVDPHSSGER